MLSFANSSDIFGMHISWQINAAAAANGSDMKLVNRRKMSFFLLNFTWTRS